jgi:hypothetical protein
VTAPLRRSDVAGSTPLLFRFPGLDHAKSPRTPAVNGRHREPDAPARRPSPGLHRRANQLVPSDAVRLRCISAGLADLVATRGGGLVFPEPLLSPLAITAVKPQRRCISAGLRTSVEMSPRSRDRP